ncbi:MAG: type secretion system protein [Rhizorhabdus sp.]|nr:type secretion system protein [Rhizorhabdus sp.]
MIVGVGFIALALLLILGVAYYALLDRHRGFALLDRRIASVAAPVAAPVRRRLAVPDVVAPVLAQAQIEPTPRMLLILIAVFVLLFVATLSLVGTAAALVAVVAPIAALIFYVRWRARSRLDALIDALPFYLDGVRQLLAVGGSLSQALVKALASAPAELQAYIEPAARRIELGAPVVESMQMLANRLRVPEISMLAAAIRVNLRFGGPMSGVLANLAQIVRERLRIQRELKAMTSETKTSTRLLIALPIVMVAFFFMSSRSYLDFFINEPRGHMLAAIAISLQLAGTMLMRHLMRMAF